jgi:hypothetical protein
MRIQLCLLGLIACSLLLWINLASSRLIAAEDLVDVEAQPLAANARRLIEALESIGQPLAADSREQLSDAIEQLDATAIQRILDPQSLVTVTINPEERVSAARGDRKAELQQGGYVPFVVKVVNQSSATPELQIHSPQAGAVYAGASIFSLQRQQQTDLGENQNELNSKERFLDLRIYREPPMTRKLSGLKVEYLIVLIYSNEAGKREATLQFDIGEGTADLAFRDQVPVLFESKPQLPVRLQIRDESQAGNLPAIGKLEIRDLQGRVYPAQTKRLAPDFFFQPHVYRTDSELVGLPPGTYQLIASRGPEYLRQQHEIQIKAEGENQIVIELQRWIDPKQFGFFSGDHHIHAAGCAHYTLPTEGVTPEQMFRQVRGEGLNVGCVLTWGPCFDYQRRFFQPKPEDFGDEDTILKYDLEISGFGSQALGHVCLLNLQDQTYPGSEGTAEKGWPTWTTPVMRWAKEQGGVTGYAHSASGLRINAASASERMLHRFDQNQTASLDEGEVRDQLLPFAFARIDTDRNQQLSLEELIAAHQKSATELPNYAIPEMNGVGAMEICVSCVAGVCDFISAMDTARIQEWNTWYHLLNCGFPLKVSGETDFPCMSSRRVGQGRVYVQLGKDATLEFEPWCRGLAAGKSYVSDGFAHAIAFKVNDVSPGFGEVQLAAPGKARILATVAFAPEMPRTVAQGTIADQPVETGDTVELHRDRDENWVQGGERKVELIVNGQVAGSKVVACDGELHELEFDVEITQSSWVALRQFPQLHTNPVNVIVNGKPIRASRQSAQWCIEMTKLLWENRQRSIAVQERPAAATAFDNALTRLAQIASESN